MAGKEKKKNESEGREFLGETIAPIIFLGKKE